MPGTRSTSRFALTPVLASVLAATGTAFAQPEAGDAGPVLEIRSMGLAGTEVHDKDRAAFDAFMLLGDRIQELGDELGMEPAQRAVFPLLWDLFNAETALRVDLGEQGPGFAMAVLPSGVGGAAELTESLGRFMTESGVPLQIDDDGAMRFATPMGPASISLGMGGGEAFTLVRAGAAGDVAPGIERYGLPAEATPTASMRVDLERLGSFLLPMMEADEPEMAALVEASGWLGENAPAIEYSAGTTDRHVVGWFGVIGGRELFSRYTGGATVPGSVFKAVPEDASLVSAAAFELDWILGMIDEAAAESGEDPFGEIQEFLGVDVRNDLLANLGPRWIYYQSGTTGGHGLLSSVMHVELQDPEAFASAHEAIVELANQMAAENANGYVRVRSWELEGTEVFSLTFPGLPIPMEPTWTVRGDRLIAALSPAGMRGALAQMNPGGRSVMDRDDFRADVIDVWPDGGALSATWVESGAMAAEGYGATSMLLSGLANAVRSPASPERSAGVLMPGYADFMSGIENYVEIGWWEGDDVVYASRGDRSMLVQMAMLIGAFGELQQLYVPAMGAGVMLPALGKARESAKQAKSASQVRSLVMALIMYGNDHDLQVPPNIDALIEGGYISRNMLSSAYGEAFDGPDIGIRLDLPGEEMYSHDASLIVAIDRSMLYYSGDTNVGFADGHIEYLTYWDLENYLEMEVNAGAREALGIED